MRCNQRVSESIISASEFLSNTFISNLAQLPEVTYSQFISSLTFANLDDDTTQKVVDWTNASLHIEFVLVAADIIGNEKLNISDRTINELAFLIADSALAIELRILKSHSMRQSFSKLSFDNSFIKEQKQLADLGLDDFSVNL